MQETRKVLHKELEQLSGVSQPVIARMMSGRTIHKIDTVMKVLAALGKTLVIVPIETMKTAK